MQKTLFVVMKMIHWENIGTDNPIGMVYPLSFSPVFGQGFMPIFEDEAEAKKHYPDCKILMIRHTTPEAGGCG